MLPGQIDVLPEIADGSGGRLFTVILKVLADDALHELFAVTEMLPLLLPAVTAMEVDVDDPDQPEGSDQV